MLAGALCSIPGGHNRRFAQVVILRPWGSLGVIPVTSKVVVSPLSGTLLGQYAP